ncbi:MAG: D-arabinono-1,4-lactone oxidase [Balneolaceae bacterium]
MKRKNFLKISSSLAAGSFLAPYIPGTLPQDVRRNWAGNYTYQAENLHVPETVEELQSLVKTSGRQKALGSRHCFNNIADSPLNQISTRHLNKLVALDEKAKTVTVEAGMRYGELAPLLNRRGYALHNLASLPHISIAGACATATHGSGVKNRNLAGAVAELELITDGGEKVYLTREDPEFYGAVVNLGALGIVARITLDVQKAYTMRQDVYQDLPLRSMKNHFDAIMSSGYSVSLFTDWQDQLISQVWIKRRTDEKASDPGPEFYGAVAATKNLHPITELSAEPCTEQLGKEGPWFERLPHFKMGFTPSSGEELQSEYFIPRTNAVDAILALEKMRDRIYPQLLISEIRTIAADELWLSPCYQQDCVAIHFTWKQNWEEVRKLLPAIEAELDPYQVVPHWGKLFTLTPDVLHSRHAKVKDFLQLARHYDPDGKFKNAYLDLNIY